MSINLINQFIEEEMPKCIKHCQEAEELRARFVKDFPKSRISNLGLDEYMIAKEGYGNPNSFCRRLRYELDPTSHMGNVRFDIFGVYLNGGTKRELSKTFEKRYGNDYYEAFDKVKSEIIRLLEAGENDDYDAIENCCLNSSFRYKLLTVYFPDKFIPVCTNDTLKDYCNRVGVEYNAKSEMVYNNISLKNWKESVPEVSSWSNAMLMSFCVWLQKKGKKIDGQSMKKSRFISAAKKIDEGIEELNLVGGEKSIIAKTRVNQSIFRDRLIDVRKKCCLCNVKNPSLLIASHIKPWCESNPEEKVDIDNGFLLCPNHDSLFDKGWISFDDEGVILISDCLEEVDRIYTNVHIGDKISLTEGNKKYLKYHRENIFKAN